MAKTEVSDKTLKQVLHLHEQGKTIKSIMETMELDYGTVWLAITDDELPANQRVKPNQQSSTKVKQLRDGGDSWGLIRVKFGYADYTEGKIRKMFEEASGLKSQGLRIGKGGRFFNRDGRFYVDDHRKPGTAIKAGTPRAELDAIAAKVSGGRMKTGPSVNGSANPVRKATKKAPGKKVAKKTTAKKVTKTAKKTTKATGKVDPFA